MTKSYRNNPRLNGIRQAIGIEGTDFELSEADLWTLFQFDVPADYDHFLQSCDQVQAKYPTVAQYKKLDRRYDQVLKANAQAMVDQVLARPTP